MCWNWQPVPQHLRSSPLQTGSIIAVGPFDKLARIHHLSIKGKITFFFETRLGLVHSLKIVDVLNFCDPTLFPFHSTYLPVTIAE